MANALSLPPYLKWDGNVHEDVKSAHFRDFPDFNVHDTIPLGMCRDFYERGETTGIWQHIDFLCLYAVRSGRAIHWIGDRPYGLVRGDIYLMAPGDNHAFCHFKDLEIDVFYFKNSLFSPDELAALRQRPGIWRLFAGDAGVDHRIHASPEEWRGIEAQIELMRQDWGDRSLAGGILLKQEFFRLLITLARLMEKRNNIALPNSDEGRLDSGLAEALRFCEEHFDKPLSVSKLAARAFLSRGHFTELFAREIGMSPAAYVRRIRLEKARALLRETNMPVAQIAAHCGFPNAAQFSRAFRHFYGSAPLQYRKKSQRESSADS